MQAVSKAGSNKFASMVVVCYVRDCKGVSAGRLHMCACVQVCKCMCVQVYVCGCACVLVHVCVRACVLVHVCAHVTDTCGTPPVGKGPLSTAVTHLQSQII